MKEFSDLQSPAMIFYLTFASIAIFVTSIACWLIFRWGDLRFNITKLMFYMFGTLLVQEWFNLPFLYSSSHSPGLCGFAAVVNTYCAVANAIATAFIMMFFYCSHSCNEAIPFNISYFIRVWSPWIIFGFPLITFFPFITDSYGVDSDIWCRLQSNNRVDNLWGIFAYHLWIVVAIAFASVMIVRSIYAACKIHSAVGGRLFSSLGSYAIVSLACWTFRLVVNILAFYPLQDGSREAFRYFAEICIPMIGIGYSIIFFYDIAMIIDLRLQSEIFDKSSFISSSILNWETIIDSLVDRPSTTSERVTVTSPLELYLRPTTSSNPDRASLGSGEPTQRVSMPNRGPSFVSSSSSSTNNPPEV